jgi:tetratricopeptide (TPR) repeat protein
VGKAQRARRADADNAGAGQRPAVPPHGAWHGAALVAATVLAYLPALGNGFIWDDDAYVTRNPVLQSLAGLRAAWLQPGVTPQYYPLVFTSFWIEHQLWGVAPFGYHAVNVALHALSAWLLWRILIALEIGVGAAWFGAALFALHPIQVESVAWVTERKNVLSAACGFASLLVYLRWAPPGEPLPRGGWAAYGLSLLLFLAALLSKTVVCALPAVLLLLRWWKGGGWSMRALAPLLPFFLLGLGFAAATAGVEVAHVGARGAEWQRTLLDRGLIAGRAVWFYLWTLAWPAQLAFNYPRWRIDAGVWWQHLFPLSLVVLAALLYAGRERLGRGGLAALLLFVGVLTPALGFFDIYSMRYSFVADHFAYLATAVAAGAVAAAIAAWGPRAGAARSWLPVLGLAWLAVLGALTARQSSVYKDEAAVWRDTLRKNPSSWIAHNNLASRALMAGDFDTALALTAAAQRLNPDYPEAYNNRGNVLDALGRRDEAIAEYQRALTLKPNYAGAHNNLGTTLLSAGRTAEAIEHYRAALAIRPKYADALSNLGNALAVQGDLAAARAQFETALRCDPRLAQAHSNLAAVLIEQRQFDAALAEADAALGVDPDYPEALYNRGRALAALRRRDAAIAAFERALALRPHYGDARRQLDALRRAPSPSPPSS